VRVRIVACEIFFRELCHLAARSPRKVDVEFLPKGLHDQGGSVMRERLQAAIDATDPEKHDAVALAYGLCNNGLVGLEARRLPLILMRGHDCITAFLGSRARYARYFDARYILETMTRHYRRLAFIRMGVEPDGSFEERTRELAAERGWR
jgi:hypothetical protein